MDNNLNITLNGLNCAHCAGKIEEKVKALNTVEEANLNFVNKEIKVIVSNNANKVSVYNDIKKIVEDIEPSVQVYEKNDSAEEEHEDDSLIIKKMLIRFGLGIIVFIAALLFNGNYMLKTSLFIGSYLIFGADVLYKAARNILKGNLFDENFLMGIATIGAFYIGEFPEAVAVMLFYQIGEFFQDLAVDKSRKSIKSLMNIKPEYANKAVGNDIEKMSPEKIEIDDVIIVKPGEKVPLDGKIIEGESFIDMSALIGESVPRKFTINDDVLSGSINNTGLLKVRVTKKYTDSTAAKILDMVENASSKKSSTENFITKFAKIYTPIVVIAAVLLAVVPPVLIPNQEFNIWLSRALVFLVSSCPCALVVSIPLGFFSGIGAASKNGILIKGSNYMQTLTEINTVVFDKTGTITRGIFDVSKVLTNNIEKQELFKYAYSLEKNSVHPVGESISNYYLTNFSSEYYDVTDFEEISGLGIKGSINNKIVLAGNAKLMKKYNIEIKECDEKGTVVYLANDKRFIGYILVSDKIKDNSKEAIKNLKHNGISNTVMLTGDKKEIADDIAAKAGIDTVYSELLPQDKVNQIENIYSDDINSKLIFVGDGINDAPVLARADIGIAMGGVGSDAAIEAADVVIMNDDLSKINDAVTISKNTLKYTKQNITFVLAVKFIVLALASVGYASMWLAVFADVGVALIAVVNSMRKKL